MVSLELIIVPKGLNAARRLLTGVFVVLLALGAFNLGRFYHLQQLIYNLNPFTSAPINDDSIRTIEPAKTAVFCSSLRDRNMSCDISKGKWVRDPSPPLYTNDTCRYIFPNQDCMTNGRPDRDFIHWKWQPANGCELASFDPALFLQLMTGKKLLFVGDSLARNHMQSLLCALVQVEVPLDLQSSHEALEYVWAFPSYNFILAIAWSPFLVNYTTEGDTWKIQVDKPHEAWTSALGEYDIAVFSTGYWYFRRSVHYLHNRSVSTYDPANATASSPDQPFRAMRQAWETVLQHLVNHFHGIAILRTISVSHFEVSSWDNGGFCNRTQPYFDDPHMRMPLPQMHELIHNLQTREFIKASADLAAKNSLGRPSCTLKLMDVSYSTLLRPDAHPGAYRIQSSTEPRNDCGHWCMPGAIDTWNQFLFADPQIMCS